MQVQRMQNNNINKQNSLNSKNNNPNFGWLKIERTPRNLRMLEDMANNTGMERTCLELIEKMKEGMKDNRYFHLSLKDGSYKGLVPEILSTKDAFWGTFETALENVEKRTIKYMPLGLKREGPMWWSGYFESIRKPYIPCLLNDSYYIRGINTYDNLKINRLAGQTRNDGLIPYSLEGLGGTREVSICDEFCRNDMATSAPCDINHIESSFDGCLPVQYRIVMALEKLARKAEGMKYSLMRNDATKSAEIAAKKYENNNLVSRLLND